MRIKFTDSINPHQLTDELRAQFPALFQPRGPWGRDEARIVVMVIQPGNRLGEIPGTVIQIEEEAIVQGLITEDQVRGVVADHAPLAREVAKGRDDLADDVAVLIPADRQRLLNLAAAEVLRRRPDLADSLGIALTRRGP